MLAENYGLSVDSIPKDFLLQFGYPIPGTSEKLPLMKIAAPKNLETTFRNMCGGDMQIVERYMVEPFLRKYADKKSLVFLHPCADKEYFDKLTQCIDPLLKTLDSKPKNKVEAGTLPPAEKLDAMIDIYWLVAQSTPVVRGGSAYANVILEHMAERLRAHGYDYEVPYTKEKVDLWFQAASLPLDDRENLKGFKTRFKEGLFFDTHAKDEDIERYLLNRLQQTIEGQALADSHSRVFVPKTHSQARPDVDARWYGF